MDPYTGRIRCAGRPANLKHIREVECELDSECMTYGPNAYCNVLTNGTYRRCGCGQNFIYDAALKACRSEKNITRLIFGVNSDKDADTCLVYNCSEFPTHCLDIFINSVCVPGASPGELGHCRCPPGYIHRDNVCLDLETYVCNDDDRPCPEVNGLSCNTNSRCTCDAKPGQDGNEPFPASFFCDQATGHQECRITSIGSTCTIDTDCPRNSNCRGSPKKKTCMCRPYHKKVTVEGSEMSDDQATCQPAIATPCKLRSDCGLASSAGKSLSCAPAMSESIRKLCLCPKGSAWNPDTMSCSTRCVAIFQDSQ